MNIFTTLAVSLVNIINLVFQSKNKVSHYVIDFFADKFHLYFYNHLPLDV